MTQGWESYDSAATTHDQVAVRTVFAQPAEGLIAALDVPTAGAILDVGSGTGIAALLALRHVHERGMVVALDTSVEMIRIARNHGLRCRVAGGVPGLPFADKVFDLAVANFVLSHLNSYKPALLDVVRVL
jgi:ubiquinone/menaquinone biosynthesis C-methylase UbiE